MDNPTQYRLKFLQRVKYRNYRTYYTWDPEHSDALVVDTRRNLVKLKSPEYSFQPKVVKQNGTSDDPLKIHKYFFLPV